MAVTHKQIVMWFKKGQNMPAIAARLDGEPIPQLQTIWKVEAIIRAALTRQDKPKRKLRRLGRRNETKRGSY